MLKIPKKVLAIVQSAHERRQKILELTADECCMQCSRKRIDALRAVDEIRSKKYTKLVIRATAVCSWAWEFNRHPEFPKFLTVANGIILLYIDNFKNGMPCPDERECCAGFLVGPGNTCHYTESEPGYASLYRFPPVSIWDFPLGKEDVVEDLVRQLHPDFLARLAEHLESGKVWGDVLRGMSRKH